MQSTLVAAKGSPRYPVLLAEIQNAPEHLYFKGEPPDMLPPMVAIVGSRNCSGSAAAIAYRLAGELTALGFCVVSGMAYGIDARAHLGALDAGGKTAAVFGCGVAVCYPREHAALMARICENGAVISEYRPHTPPARQHFPARNRIISGLALGTIIVEARERSGTFITAAYTREQGRVLMTVSNNALGYASKGNAQLIEDGALAVADGRDVAEAVKDGLAAYRVKREQQIRLCEEKGIDITAKPSGAAIAAQASGVKPPSVVEAAILRAIGKKGATLEELVAQTGCTLRDLQCGLTALEIKQLIRKSHTGCYMSVYAHLK